jgi:hypothetical protein
VCRQTWRNVVHRNPPTKKNQNPVEKIHGNREDAAQHHHDNDIVFSAVEALLCRLPTNKKALREPDFQPPKLPLSA